MSDIQLPTEGNPLKTTGQTVWINAQSLVIKYGVMYYGFLGTKSVPVRNIKTVTWQDPGAIIGGFLEISVLGEMPPSPLASPNVQHQNRFRYPAQEIERWRALRDWIQENITTEGNGSAATSVADEFTKLFELREKGIITPEEFDVQKAKLLKQD